MEILSKIIRGIASIPLFGGYFVLLVGFFPIVGLIPLGLSTGMLLVIGGLMVAAWCYFLKAKNIINIVTPIIPIPNWVLGVVMAIAGVYGMVTNTWDESNTDPDLVRQEMTAPKSVSVPENVQKPVTIPKPDLVDPDLTKPDTAELEKEIMLQEASSIDLSKMRDEASKEGLIALEEALAGLEQVKINMEEISKSIGQEKFDQMMGEQMGSDYSMILEEDMAELRKQIAELKSKGYGAGNTE